MMLQNLFTGLNLLADLSVGCTSDHLQGFRPVRSLLVSQPNLDRYASERRVKSPPVSGPLPSFPPRSQPRFSLPPHDEDLGHSRKNRPRRDLIIELRIQNHSVYEISEALKERKSPLNPTAVREVLKEEGFAPLPRRL